MLVPVALIVVVVLSLTLDGDRATVGVLTAIVVVSLPSEIVNVPVPDPVVTTSVAARVDVIVCEIS